MTAAWAATLAGAGLPAADGARYAPDQHVDLSHLTPDDREMIAAVTGTVVSSTGEVRTGDPDDPLAAALADDRVYGRVTGLVSAVHLRALERRYAEPGDMYLEPAVVDRATAWCAARDRRRGDDPTPRSSFSIAV